MSTRSSSAVRRAREDDFDDGVRLGSLELQQALDAPSLRTGMSASAIARLVKGIALVAPLGGLLAPIGGSGADVFSGTGSLSPDVERSIVMICFVIAPVGQVWALVDWWRLGRSRDGNGVAAAALALVAAVGAMWWHVSRAELTVPPMLMVLITLTGVLGAVALVARLAGSRSTTAQEVKYAALGERMRSLPDEEQHAMLAERREILEMLRSRNFIDDTLATRAAAARLGDWWLLDAEREVASSG